MASPRCVEAWAIYGKEHLTTDYHWFLARWAKRLSWQETADACGATWDNVLRSANHAVEWGLAHWDLSGVEAIGVDEIQWRSGRTYLALVSEIDEMKYLFSVTQELTEQSLRRRWHRILNWFRARGTISSGVVEDLEGKAKPATRKVLGFRTPLGAKIALFHVLGRLPEPKFTQTFR